MTGPGAGLHPYAERARANHARSPAASLSPLRALRDELAEARAALAEAEAEEARARRKAAVLDDEAEARASLIERQATLVAARRWVGSLADVRGEVERRGLEFDYRWGVAEQEGVLPLRPLDELRSQHIDDPAACGHALDIAVDEMRSRRERERRLAIQEDRR